MTRRTQPPDAEAAPHAYVDALQDVLNMATIAATQLAALETRAARPTLFFLALFLAPLAAAARRRRIRELRKITALLAALAEVFSAAPPAAAVAAPAADATSEPMPPVRTRVRHIASRGPAARVRPRRQVEPARTARRPVGTQSHTLRPAARGSPARTPAPAAPP